MPKSLVKWMLLTGLLWASSTMAAPGMTIIAMEPPAWVLQDGDKTALTPSNKILAGTRLLTGDSGKLALQLEPGTRLQLDVNTEIELIAGDNPESAAARPLSAIKVRLGRACMQFRLQPDVPSPVDLLAADAVSVAIHEQGHICVNLGEDRSSIALVEGTVQITNLVEPAMVVLSEAGSEYRFDDTGYFELDKSETALPIEVSNKVITRPEVASEDEPTAETGEPAAVAEPAVTTEVSGEISETGSSDTPSPYVYTVYLFSTRSQEVANEVNQKLIDAGHQSLIITSEAGAATRYRIAVSGFSSRQSAQDFSAAIIGKYGIGDTWIGRQKIAE